MSNTFLAVFIINAALPPDHHPPTHLAHPWTTVLLPSPNHVRHRPPQGRQDLHLHAQDSTERDHCIHVRGASSHNHLWGRPVHQWQACLLWRLHLLWTYNDLTPRLPCHQAIFSSTVHPAALGFIPCRPMWCHIPPTCKRSLYNDINPGLPCHQAIFSS